MKHTTKLIQQHCHQYEKKLQKTSKSQIRTIVKDAIIFEQKDSLYIHSNELKELNTYVSEIKHELSKEKDTFLGATYDTVFTVLVTISIFVLGIIIDRRIKYLQGKDELKKFKDYFNNQFSELKNSILPKLVKGYRKSYQETITIDKGLPTTAPKILTNTYDRLSNLESPLLFKTFKNSSDFNTAFSQIDFIKKLMTEIDQYHSISLKRSSSIRNLIAKLDSRYMNKFVEYTVFQSSNDPNFATNPNIIFINEKVDFYNKHISGKRSLTKHHKEIIRPVNEYLVSTNLFKTDPICKEIWEYGKQLSNKFHELKRLFIEIRLQYRTFSINLNNSKNKLEKLNTD